MDTPESSGAPENGEPTASASSQTQSNPTNAPAPEGSSSTTSDTKPAADGASDPPAKKKGGASSDSKDTPPSKKKPRAVILGTKGDLALTQAAAYPDDPAVQEDVADVTGDREALGEVNASPGFDADQLAKLESQTSQLLAVLVVAVDHFIRAISMTARGKAFASTIRGASTPSTARNLLRDASSEVVGHNQPLLDAIQVALANYEPVAAALATERVAKNAWRAVAKKAMDRLALSVGALEASVARASKRAQRAALLPAPKKGKHGKLAA